MSFPRKLLLLAEAERELDVSAAGWTARLSVSGVEGQAEDDERCEAGSARTSSCLRQTAC